MLAYNIASIVIEGIITGIAFALLVPILQDLFHGTTQDAWAYLYILLGFVAVYALLRFSSQIAGYLAAIRLARVLYRKIGEHLAKLPMGWFSEDRVGSLTHLAGQGVMDAVSFPAHLLRPHLTSLVTPAVIILIMFFFDWRLAIAVLATSPLAYVTYRWVGNRIQSSDLYIKQAAEESASRLIEFSQAQQVLRAFSQQGNSHHRLDAVLAEQRQKGRQQIFFVGPVKGSFALMIQIGFTIVLALGTYLALGGHIKAPELIALLVLAVRYAEPLIIAADLQGAMRMGVNTLNKISTLLKTPMLPEATSSSQPASTEIRFDNVSFKYDAHLVLKNIDMTIPPHSMTAIIGPSGSGKTTMLHVLARFWDVTDGCISLGGVDIRALTGEQLMEKMSIVFQKVYLFEGTIEDNIRYSRPDATPTQLERALNLAGIDEMIARLPDGLQSWVGEGGITLSGGERQRISIARAILKDAPVVLFDEATAALDSTNEKHIRNGFDALRRDKTVIVVTHQLRTIKFADQIIMLDQGQVIEKGSHDDLLAHKGRYAEFWEMRERVVGWQINQI